MARPDSAHARRRLDTRLRRLRPLVDEPRPHRGWIRAIRDALGMSSTELAKRIGVSQQAVVSLEQSEVDYTAKLETLRSAAEALDCQLVYALVPRTSLNDAVIAQARRKAARLLTPVVHHSRLEDQSIADDDTAAQVDELAQQFVDRRGLWADSDLAR